MLVSVSLFVGMRITKCNIHFLIQKNTPIKVKAQLFRGMFSWLFVICGRKPQDLLIEGFDTMVIKTEIVSIRCRPFTAFCLFRSAPGNKLMCSYQIKENFMVYKLFLKLLTAFMGGECVFVRRGVNGLVYLFNKDVWVSYQKGELEFLCWIEFVVDRLLCAMLDYFWMTKNFSLNLRFQST